MESQQLLQPQSPPWRMPSTYKVPRIYMLDTTTNLLTGAQPAALCQQLPMSFIMSTLLFPFPAQLGLPASYKDMDLKKGYCEVISTAAPQPASRGLSLLKMLLIKHQQVWNPNTSFFSLVMVCFLPHFLKKCSL